MTKKKILILNAQYLPGFKGGGPVQSCANIVENLWENYEFWVLCKDRDLKDERQYNTVKIDQWNIVGHAKVFYMSSEMQKLKNYAKLLNSIQCDCIYMNNFFSPQYTIKPLLMRKLRMIQKKQFILAVRGDFTAGCQCKKVKKYSFIFVAKLVGLYKDILWHATSEMEGQDIKKKFPNADIVTVPNLSAPYIKKDLLLEKKEGELKLVFLSRISPTKNLKYALEVLQKIKQGNVIYNIYGPIEDKEYWNKCKKIIQVMPPNVEVNYCGEVDHNQVADIFSQYHGFFFPTLGENYGHVIVEAMMNNCLCLLNKGVTPWDSYIDVMELGARLDHKDKLINDINKLIMLNQGKYLTLLDLNNDYISKKVNVKMDIGRYITMFGC